MNVLTNFLFISYGDEGPGRGRFGHNKYAIHDITRRFGFILQITNLHNQ